MTVSISNLRAQMYDGSADMSGRSNGCQAIIKSNHPYALHLNYAAHCSDLVVEATAESWAVLRDVLADVSELGVLYKRSGKYSQMFDIANAYEMPRSLKPLCPTRWLYRVRSLNAVGDQYDVVLTSLKGMSKSTNGDISTKKNTYLVLAQVNAEVCNRS